MIDSYSCYYSFFGEWVGRELYFNEVFKFKKKQVVDVFTFNKNQFDTFVIAESEVQHCS